MPYSPSMLNMRLRDYFAGQALMGMLAVEVIPPTRHIAKAAYEFADAMPDERETEKEKKEE